MPRAIKLHVIQNEQKIPLKVSTFNQVLEAYVERVKIVHGMDYPIYDGAIDIVPSSEAQTLPTQDTIVKDDIEVEAIPFYMSTNPSGGYTVVIGRE